VFYFQSFLLLLLFVSVVFRALCFIPGTFRVLCRIQAQLTQLSEVGWLLGASGVNGKAPSTVPAPANIYVIMPLRFKLSGRPVLSTHLNVETAGSERKTAGSLNFGVCDFLADPDSRRFSRF
jgi:hypothetical protein